MTDPTVTPDPMDEAANTEPLRRRRDVGRYVLTDDAKRIRDEAVTAERARIRRLVAERYDTSEHAVDAARKGDQP